MADVLSQEEVDALLSGLTGGSIASETDQPPSRSDFVVFDFTNQDRIVRGRLPTLEMIHDRFSRLFRQSVSAAMQRVIDVNVLNTDASKFGEFMRGQAIPSSYHIFRMEPLKGSALVVLEGKLVFTMVNSFLGGRGTSYYKMEGRDFTAIENRIVKTVVDLLLQDYQNAWAPVKELRISHTRAEINPQFVSIVPPSDAVWVIEMEMSFEDVSEKLCFCLPYSTLEPLMDKLKARYQSESMTSDNTWMGRIKETLNEVPLEVIAQLGTSQITGRQVLALKPGDIIQLRERCDDPLNVYIEGVLKLKGKAGSYRSSKAIQITEVLPCKMMREDEEEKEED
jgi:flagellar motor switch protein FliM